MDIDDRFQVSSKNGMTMLVLRETVVGDGTPERKSSRNLTIMDRTGKVIRDNLVIPVNTKDEHEWLVELHELLEQVVQKIRGW